MNFNRRCWELVGAACSVVAVACAQRDTSSRADSPSTQPNARVGTSASAAVANLSGCPPTDVCFRDTALGRELDYEPGWVVEARWLAFVAAQDSVELYGTVAGRPEGIRLSVTVGSARGYQERDSHGNTASLARLRVNGHGVMRIQIGIDDHLGDTVEYELRMRVIRPHPQPALQPSGKYAGLEIVAARDTDWSTIVPQSFLPQVTDSRNWTVARGSYKVALGPDSIYHFCGIPCSTPQILKLRHAEKVVARRD